MGITENLQSGNKMCTVNPEGERKNLRQIERWNGIVIDLENVGV